MHPRQPLNSLLARLLIGSGIPLILFLAVALVAWVIFARLLNALAWEKHTHEAISQAQMRQQKLDRMRLAGLAQRVLPAENRRPFADSYRSNRADFHALGAELAHSTADNDEQRTRLERIDRLAGEWERLVGHDMAQLPDPPPRAELERQAMTFFQQTDGLLQDLQTELDHFVQAEEALLALRRAQTTYETWQSSLIIGGAVLAAVLLTVLVSWQSARGVTQPINALGAAASELVAGRFQNVPPRGPNEIAQLIVHFNHMAMTLTEEADLRAAKEAAEATSRAKSAFLAKMSHELRTPLNAVIGMSRMLATLLFGPLTPKQADYVKDINQAGEHLLVLINDILDLEKVESGKLEMQAESLPALSAMNGLISTLRPLAEPRRVALRLAAPAEDGTLNTDPARFRQVLYNLLSNAIKFTPGPGTVTVYWEWVERPERTAPLVPVSAAGAIRVAVSDTGIGIAPADQEVIWEEFRQLPAPGGGAREGTGLGLALTRRLVQLLGGSIWVDSQVGKGSTFTFVLPRTLSAAAMPDGGAAAAAGGLTVEGRVGLDALAPPSS